MHVADIARIEGGKVLDKGRILVGCAGAGRALLAGLIEIRKSGEAAAVSLGRRRILLEYGPDSRPMGLASHLARIVILSCQLAGVLGIDLEGAIEEVIGYEILRSRGSEDANPRILV